MSPADAASLAIEAVLSRFERLVRHAGASHGLSNADVDEVFQDIRIRLWRAHPQSEQIATLGSSYMYRTAMSAVTDLLRRRQSRREERLEPGEHVQNTLSAAPLAPDVELESSEAILELSRSIEALPASRRPVVRMHLAGYSREEIAKLLGWSEAKTRNLLYRGLADLRSALLARGVGAAARP
ncbi:MAG TPA: sigma-70 family RNA polymerase sigma factor [Gemmatimonadaceae bacterium]|nr:sigma-70 family RNA polymerase sigma factor [Gemmatimonadaceae bacterium]